MITLYQFPATWGIPNPSPFCMKVETYLRLANIPYECNYTLKTSISPKDKFPAIKDGDTLISDSELIIEYLKSHYGDPLDASLNESEVAQGILLERIFCEHLYWCLMYFRWIYEPGWSELKKALFAKVPAPARNIVANQVKKYMNKSLYHQGIGRHTQTEITHMLEKDLRAISFILGNKPFILGDKLSSIDATAFGFLENLLNVPFEHPPTTLALHYQNLVDYCNRMRELWEKAN